MGIDGKWMADVFWDSVMNGLKWMVTSKSLDDPVFPFWIAVWVLCLIIAVLMGKFVLNRLGLLS